MEEWNNNFEGCGTGSEHAGIVSFREEWITTYINVI